MDSGRGGVGGIVLLGSVMSTRSEEFGIRLHFCVSCKMRYIYISPIMVLLLAVTSEI